MKTKIALLVAAGGLSASSAISAQQPNIIQVPINVQQVNDGTIFNPNPDPLTIVVLCNATSANKRIEAWVAPPQGTQVMVASESGTERQSITFVVPVGWSFIITAA